MNMIHYVKITEGSVHQQFGNDGKCIRQFFITGDRCDYEDTEGNPIRSPKLELYIPFTMKQPEEMK